MKMITKRGIFLWILAVAFLFGLGFMTYSLVENGDTWVMKTYNTHIYKNGDLIGAGTIKSADGAVLAETKDGKRVYAEDATVRKATLHTVGDTKGFISSGIQSVYKADLTGYNLLFGVYSIERYGKGNNMRLTIDSRVCAKAYSLLSDYKAGTVGVVNYKTGDIVCAVSTPSYDMEDEPSDLNTNSAYEGVYINRLMTGLYTPGSTFKLVTAACAIENIPDLMDRTWECTGEYDPGKGEPIRCNGVHGRLTFKQALAKSCNATFAQIAIELGPEKLASTVETLGLTSRVTVSNKLNSEQGRFFLEKSDPDDYVGWTGIGQGDTLLPPIAMLRYMAAIANDGKAVSFNEVNSLASQAGKALNLNITKNETQLLSTETAAQLKKLMRNNVKAQYGEYNYKGLHLCAKSGTAEVDKDTDHNTAWFVGFMDDVDHPYAFVVVVEHGGSGSQTAGPIAGSVLRTLVDKESK